MGHLNELQEKYGAKGLTVVSITNEPRGLVDKYIEEARKWNYPDDSIRRWLAALHKAGLPE